MISIKKTLTKILVNLNTLNTNLGDANFLIARSISSGTFTMSDNFRGFLFIAASSTASQGFYGISTTSTGSVVKKDISASSSNVTLDTSTDNKVTISVGTGNVAVCFMVISGTITKTA